MIAAASSPRPAPPPPRRYQWQQPSIVMVQNVSGPAHTAGTTGPRTPEKGGQPGAPLTATASVRASRSSTHVTTSPAPRRSPTCERDAACPISTG